MCFCRAAIPFSCLDPIQVTVSSIQCRYSAAEVIDESKAAGDLTGSTVKLQLARDTHILYTHFVFFCFDSSYPLGVCNYVASE